MNLHLNNQPDKKSTAETREIEFFKSITKEDVRTENMLQRKIL